jgi:hypothetical protein
MVSVPLTDTINVLLTDTTNAFYSSGRKCLSPAKRILEKKEREKKKGMYLVWFIPSL